MNQLKIEEPRFLTKIDFYFHVRNIFYITINMKITNKDCLGRDIRYSNRSEPVLRKYLHYETKKTNNIEKIYKEEDLKNKYKSKLSISGKVKYL
jgi:hypothetical protein